MKILGIDPGYGITGFGLIEIIGNRHRAISYDAIHTSANTPMPERLLSLYESLEKIIVEKQPDRVAVEELFFNKNVSTAILAGQGRGMALLAAAKYKVPVYEYTPLQVKQAVTGYGRADKAQIQQMVKILLNLPSIPKPDDVSDALAVAICHAQFAQIEERLMNR